MAVRIPTFADVGFNDPRSGTPSVSYPQADPEAAALGTLGQGVSQAGGAALRIANDMEDKRQKLNAANSTLGLFNEMVPLHSQMQLETDPAKLGEIKNQMTGLLAKYSQGIDDPVTKAVWLSAHSNAVIHAVTDVDRRFTELDRSRMAAGLIEQIDTTARTAAAAADPNAIAAASAQIRDLAKYGEEYDALKPGAGYSAQRQALDKMVRGAADNLLNQRRPDQALALLENHANDVDPVAMEGLRRRIETAKEKQGAKAAADAEWGGGDKGYAGARGGGMAPSGDAGDRIAATLKARGWSDAAVTGALNNAMTESSLNANATGAAGEKGLFQFHPDSHIGPFTQAYHGDWSPEAQANYVADVVGKTMPEYAQAGDARQATAQFLRGFEKPKDQSDTQLNARLANSGAAQAIVGRTGAAPSGDTGNVVAFGDSIAAHLIRKAGAGGQESGKVGAYDAGDTAVSGYNPSEVLKVISNTPDDAVRGKSVILSTGTSNDPDNKWKDSIPEQIAMLRGKGAASVTVMGVGTKYADRNDQLAQIASDNGAAFSGPLRRPASDGIHSSDPKAELAAVRQAPAPAGLAAASVAQPGTGQTGAANFDGGTAPLPNIDAMTARVQERADRGELSQNAANAAMADLRSRYNHLQASQSDARAALAKQLNNGAAQLQDGGDFSYDPSLIRHYFPAEKADAIIQQLDDARDGGQLVTGLRTSSPDQVAQQREQLAAGLDDPNATNYAKRRRMLVLFDKAVTERDKLLVGPHADPAGYVAQYSPTVADKYKAIDPRKPETFADYATSALAEQSRLGVPAEIRWVLPVYAAAQMATRIASIDPAKQNPGEAMSQMAQSYGAYWPQVFGDLVQTKLPGTYQVLATMDRPEQGVAASDLSRAIGLVAEKGGMSAMKKAVPDTTQKAIDKGLDDALSDFRESVGNQEGGARLYATVRDAAQALSYYYGFRGKSDSEAVQAAVDGILNAKYDFGHIAGTMVRVPKGTLGVVDSAAQAVQKNINVDDLGPVRGNELLTPEQRKEIWFGAIHNGSWVNNEDDSGIVLMGQFRNGLSVVRRADGSRIEVKFANAPALAASHGMMPLPSSPDVSLRAIQ